MSDNNPTTTASETTTPAPPNNPAAGKEEAPEPRVGIRHPVTGHQRRCTVAEYDMIYKGQGYELIPHSAGHGTPPDAA